MSHAWGEDRIICVDEKGSSRSVLASWTDYPTPDHYTAKEHNVDFKFDDLQMLAKLLADISGS
jgi:hypothetical protein